ncbi:uncharacterized protein LOC126570625 [Anopheles aquasalis]|uniref:uncharacterized protein LOC126570625 n=1 Tax=Anopheles aquasalis TaxID=42839 RepID=UPI00215B1033|nr:uncharacterized protein LOC126570625 [Anopheles aquasalis]XP_050084502.1 uncharacterized protein LOC126570625 [Anopheles aquasalis]XP_050084503.1 uncharacterized protein LOC126570625 [Anopheles aquasalis]XP_050084504.1 uncharacterized protein LOC126570625 [Anopheles aquasalis]
MDKPSRPVRNRKRSRKAWPPGDTHGRPVKRLFTPEIKRLLKDWLVRRRDNPYPNREEKKLLAIETGLTYTQICNWFANWRRKLKNSGNDPLRKTWGNLIRHYNTNARGNVEQFSICSSDSIWSGADGEDSNDSRHTSPASARNGRPEHVVMLHATARQHGAHGACRMPFSYVKYSSPPASADPYDEMGYNEMHPHPRHNKNSASFRSKNGRKCAEYVRRFPPEYSTSPTTSSTSVCHGQLDESPSSYEDVRPTCCFDHCYTPRNYETVFGIPEDTRCYKIEAGHKYIPDGSHATLEPLILTAKPSGFGRFEHGNERTGLMGTTTATLFLAQSPHLSPTTTGATLPVPAQNRSSKYKSSMMEKYLRDLSELEADHSRQPVIMATIPFQRSYQNHHHHLCHRGSVDEEPDHDATDPYRAEPALVHAIMDSADRLSCDTGVLDAPPPSLSKWLESAAKFTPAKHNYIGGDWEKSGKQSTAKKRCDSGGLYGSLSGHPGQGTNGISLDNALGSDGSVTLTHQKDEIDAAEALTRLANNFRTKFSS